MRHDCIVQIVSRDARNKGASGEAVSFLLCDDFVQYEQVDAE